MGVRVREKPKGSGVWWIFIEHQGKRKAKKIGKDKRLAKELAKRIEAKLALGDFDLDPAEKAPVFTLSEYANLWLEKYVKPLRRETTVERYSHTFKRYIDPALGSRRLDEITRKDVRDLLLSIHGKGLSYSTVCLARDVLSGIFNHAVDDEVVSVNPVQGVVKRLQLDRKKNCDFEAFTKDEVSHFLAVCREYRPDYHAFFLTAFRTGARLGELLALTWGDIDFHGKFIRINKSWKRGKITPTKTGRVRRVDMSDQLSEELKVLLSRRKKEALAEGRQVHDYLFHDGTGKPLSQNTVRNVFKAVLKRAGLREIRLHDIRHTFASLLLSDGQSPVYVKEQLGHSSIQMTVDIYGHLIPSSNREAVNRLDETQPSATYPQPAEKE